MAKSIEMILAEMSLRVRLLMSAENAGKRIAGLSERETLLLELIGTKKGMCISEIAEFFGGVSSSTISMTITKLWRKHKLVDKTIMPKNQRNEYKKASFLCFISIIFIHNPIYVIIHCVVCQSTNSMYP